MKIINTFIFRKAGECKRFKTVGMKILLWKDNTRPLNIKKVLDGNRS